MTTAPATARPSPTKAEELAIIACAIAELTPDSYLGPWLQHISGELQSSIRCDIFPGIDITGTEARCRQMARNATDDAAATRDRAQEYSRQTIAAADARAAEIIAQAEDRARGIIASQAQKIRELRYALDFMEL